MTSAVHQYDKRSNWTKHIISRRVNTNTKKNYDIVSLIYVLVQIAKFPSRCMYRLHLKITRTSPCIELFYILSSWQNLYSDFVAWERLNANLL